MFDFAIYHGWWGDPVGVIRARNSSAGIVLALKSFPLQRRPDGTYPVMRTEFVEGSADVFH